MKIGWTKQFCVTCFVIMASLSAITLYLITLLSQRFQVMVNVSHSLPFQVGILIKPPSFGKGQWVAFHPPASALHGRSDILVKIISGIPGDNVTHCDDTVIVNDELIGSVQTRTKNNIPLHPGFSGEITDNYYFVSSPHPDSFDSRYREVGLIHQSQLLGRVVVLW